MDSARAVLSKTEQERVDALVAQAEQHLGHELRGEYRAVAIAVIVALTRGAMR